METDLEYQSTRAYDRHAVSAMFRAQPPSDDAEDGNATERWDRDRFEAWLRSRQTPDQEIPEEPAMPPPADPPPPPSTEALLASVLDQRAVQESGRGRLAAARALHEQAMELRRKLLGEADPTLPQSFIWLGNLALREGRLEEAHWLYEQARQGVEKTYGATHVMMAVPLHNLAVTARHAGDLALAADLYEQALALKLEHLGWGHPSVATTLSNLGNLARHTGDAQAAMCYYAQAREIFEQTLGGVNSGLAASLIGLGRVHLQYGMHVSAAFMFERAVRIREAIDVTPIQLAGARLMLATALAPNQPDDAREVLGTAMKEYQRAGEVRPECVQAMRALAETLPRG